MCLQEALMRSAALAGALHHRSAAQQIEYWASLGQGVSSQLDPESLLDVAAGLARLKVEPSWRCPLTLLLFLLLLRPIGIPAHSCRP